MMNARPSSPSPQHCAVKIRLAAYLNSILANTMRPVVRLGLILAYQNEAHVRISSQGPSASGSRAKSKVVPTALCLTSPAISGTYAWIPSDQRSHEGGTLRSPSRLIFSAGLIMTVMC